MGDTIIKSYNQNIKTLVHILNNKYENKNKDIIELGRIISTALSIDLNVIIEESGPYLIEHSDELNNLDNFIAKSNFDDKISNELENDKQKLIKNIIDSIKNIWPKMNAKEKELITKLLKNMMTEYSQFILSK